MRGDRLLIEPCHRKAAEAIRHALDTNCSSTGRTPVVVSIGGESGSGKSEIGRALADLYANDGKAVVLLQQDDYFRLPPKTNEQKRRRNIGWVGMEEVRLDLLDAHLMELREGASELVKPLVDYAANEITDEALQVKNVEIVIVEGTYTTVLKSVDSRVFIDRTYIQTAASRRRRARDAQDPFIDQVLELEHQIIAAHIERADIVVTSDYGVIAASHNQTEG